MKWVVLYLSYLIIFLCFLLHFPSYNCLVCNPYDKHALLQFKNSFVVVNSSLGFDYCSSHSSETESWKNITDCCGWDGVTCNSSSGHVIGLDLSCSSLRGEVLGPNSSIFRLSHLQQLSLAFNDFSASSIHSAIGDLVNLTDLTLSWHGTSGDVPSTISHLSKLQYLYLSGDSRTRLDPYTWNKLIQNATNLREISLEGVNMSCVGERSLSLLTNLSSSLVSLQLSDTQIQGKWPTQIFRLLNLQEIDLSYNENLRGELPNSNWTTSLSVLSLSQTAFSGYIPHSIAHLKSLNVLILSGCSFNGFLPPSLFNLTQLYFLDLSYNELVGPIPTQITELSKLSYLFLSGNMLNGLIPRWCYSLPSLSMLDLHHNQLTGSIGEFSNFLQTLWLSNNKLQGNFPNSIFGLQSLVFLSLQSTDLSGVVDFHQFSKLRALDYLDLSNNSFLSVNFEYNFDYVLPNLRYLSLSSCNVSSFPKFLAPLQSLQVLDLSDNIIGGSTTKSERFRSFS